MHVLYDDSKVYSQDEKDNKEEDCSDWVNSRVSFGIYCSDCC